MTLYRVEVETGRGVRCLMVGLESASTTAFVVTLDLPSEGVRSMVARWTILADFPDRLTVGPPLTIAQMGRIVGKGLVKALQPIANLFESSPLRDALKAIARVQQIETLAPAMGIDGAGIVGQAEAEAVISPLPFRVILDRRWSEAVQDSGFRFRNFDPEDPR